MALHPPKLVFKDHVIKPGFELASAAGGGGHVHGILPTANDDLRRSASTHTQGRRGGGRVLVRMGMSTCFRRWYYCRQQQLVKGVVVAVVVVEVRVGGGAVTDESLGCPTAPLCWPTRKSVCLCVCGGGGGGIPHARSGCDKAPARTWALRGEIAQALTWVLQRYVFTTGDAGRPGSVSPRPATAITTGTNHSWGGGWSRGRGGRGEGAQRKIYTMGRLQRNDDGMDWEQVRWVRNGIVTDERTRMEMEERRQWRVGSPKRTAAWCHILTRAAFSPLKRVPQHLPARRFLRNARRLPSPVPSALTPSTGHIPPTRTLTFAVLSAEAVIIRVRSALNANV